MTSGPFRAAGRDGLLIDGRDLPGARLGPRRDTVAEIVDVAVDRAPMIGLEPCRQMTTEVLKQCRS